MSVRPDLSVVVPVHNEASRVGAGLQELVDYLGALGLTSEIVLVDDGSSDGTLCALIQLTTSLICPERVRHR
jgi:glycosyltransferase involved in cell wall biosynthesis